jgi:hypothetical protein
MHAYCRSRQGRAGPAGAAAAARGSNNNVWIGVAAACRRAGKSCMHALWGLPKQSGRRGCGADVPSVNRIHQKSTSYASFPIAYRESALREWAGSTRGRDVRVLVFSIGKGSATGYRRSGIQLLSCTLL